jgi:hypothetical protein
MGGWWEAMQIFRFIIRNCFTALEEMDFKKYENALPVFSRHTERDEEITCVDVPVERSTVLRVIQ